MLFSMQHCLMVGTVTMLLLHGRHCLHGCLHDRHCIHSTLNSNMYCLPCNYMVTWRHGQSLPHKSHLQSMNTYEYFVLY